ncbi:phosphoribosylglycinamide formyltransferase [bacterium]|nr:phosphoribosylglycinamide formyltransferase [bacterium]
MSRTESTTYVPRPFPIQDGPVRLAVCISGAGSTLSNLLKRIDDGSLGKVKIELVIADRPGIKGLEIAEARGIPTLVVARKDLHMSRTIFETIRAARVDLVVLGGFLSLLFVPDDYEYRVLNIHPSLIPAFCGRGYYGRAVHQAAIESGVKVTGCTVHFADRSYDTGPIIIQKVVPVEDDDTVDSLAARVFAAECEALPAAIRLVIENRIGIRGRRTVPKIPKTS